MYKQNAQIPKSNREKKKNIESIMVILKSSFNSQYPKIGITNISNEMLHR